MKVDVAILLLGSEIVLDRAALVLLTVAVGLFAVLWGTSNRTLRAAPGARIAFVLSLLGAAAQIVAGEALLFLAGGTVLGFAMLALGMTRPRALAPVHAKSVALLLVAGDLALLELVMLLAKSSPGLRYPELKSAFDSLIGDALPTFCFVLGFGSRMALPVLCITAYGRSAASRALLPGWLVVGICAGFGVIRISAIDMTNDCCNASLLNLFWWVPVLVVLAWQLPRIIPALQNRFIASGHWAGRCRSRAMAALRPFGTVRDDALRRLLQAEVCLAHWPVAIGFFLLVLGLCTLTMLAPGIPG